MYIAGLKHHLCGESLLHDTYLLKTSWIWAYEALGSRIRNSWVGKMTHGMSLSHLLSVIISEQTNKLLAAPAHYKHTHLRPEPCMSEQFPSPHLLRKSEKQLSARLPKYA